MPNPRSQKYPTEVVDAIWALMCEGKKAAEITRLLENGDAGLDYKFPANRHTVIDWGQRLKRERGEPRQYIAPGREATAASAIMRSILDRTRKEWDKLSSKEDFSLNDVKFAAQLLKLMLDTQKQLAEMERDKSKDPDRAAAGRKGGASSNVLAEIAKREAARKRDESAASRPAAVANGESPASTRPDPSTNGRQAEGSWNPYETSGEGWPD